MWGREGALCLSLVATRSSGDFVEHQGRTPTRTSTRPPPPLHPTPCPYRTLDHRSHPPRASTQPPPPLPPTPCPYGTLDHRSHPNQDKHQAPSSTPPHPLSLQAAGPTFPNSVGTIHQDPGPQAPQWRGFPDSVVNIH